MKHSVFAPALASRVRLLVLAAMLTILIGTQPVRAEPYVVTNTNDSGPGSLRQAITDANNNPDADTITFDPATDGVPIILTGAAGEDANASGDLDILDSGFSLTIQGNGSGKTIIDGDGIDRVFHVCPGGGCPIAFEVTLIGLTIRNGAVQGSASGGGIHNAGGHTIVDNTTVAGNGAKYGAGIHNGFAATLTVRNGSTIGGHGAANHAFTGGGIYNGLGIVVLDASSVLSNTATYGGGIHNLGLLDVQNGSAIGQADLGNEALEGGGLYNDGGTMMVKDSTVEGNESTDGAGIYNRIGTLTCEGCSIIGNTASGTGGGIYSGEGTVTIEEATISANRAEHAGGIYNEDDLTITNTTIGQPGAGNEATGYGGGIFNYGANTLVRDCFVGGNTADDGGGIYNYGFITVEGGSIISNTARFGGGLYDYLSSTVDGTLIIRNKATAHGGGIYAAGGLTVKNGATIGRAGAGNLAVDLGGGIFLDSYSATVDASTISANAAKDGGGIYVAAGDMTVTSSRILDNTASANGGGVSNARNWTGAVDVTGSCIVGNSDIAFYNSQPAWQIATHNWWGAPAGPNMPGADTVGGNVNTSSYLPAPILGCTPDLRVAKANNTGGSRKVSLLFTWTLTVSNTGVTDAPFEDGQTILVDELPTGPDYGVPTPGNTLRISGGTNIDCDITNRTLTCQALGGTVTIGAAGSFAVIVPVTASTTGTMTNPAGVCRVDPENKVDEADEDNNDCNEDEVEISAWRVYLPMVVR